MKQMLSFSQRCDLSLLYFMKQWKDQTKRFYIFISFGIQIENKLFFEDKNKNHQEKSKTKTERIRKTPP